MSPPSTGTAPVERAGHRTWAGAADRLARQATRRARIEAFARPAAALLLTTGALTLVGRWARQLDGGFPAVLVGSGVVGAVLLGLRAARRVPATTPASAAWALDRLADAHERGLTAATLGDDRATPTAGTPLPPRPAARLRPADGTALVLGAALVPLAALLWPGPAPIVAPSESLPETQARLRGAVGGEAAAEAARADEAARVADTEAATERAIRAALGVAGSDPLDVATIAERLADPAARRAALAVAPEKSAAAAALSTNTPGAAAALARALDSGAAARADALRRDAAGVRARSDALAIPPARRAVVARYLSSSLTSAERTPPSDR